MTKKISEVSIRQIAFGNRQIEGFSSGIWETDEIIVGDNEIENFFYVLLFPSDKDVYSSGCAVPEFQLVLLLPGSYINGNLRKKLLSII